jgi:hypothetical protein
MYTCAQFRVGIPLHNQKSEDEKSMQIDFELTEVHANELAEFLRKPAGKLAEVGPIEFELIKPLSGVLGDTDGKWTVRLKTSFATAAQLATIVGFLWLHVPATPTAGPTPSNPISITLSTGKSTMHFEANNPSDSRVLEAAIADYIEKNGPPEKVQVKHGKTHHVKK